MTNTYIDVPCCFLLLGTLLIQLSIFLYSIASDADPRRLLYYTDWEGEICAPGFGFSSFVVCVCLNLLRICVYNIQNSKHKKKIKNLF